MYCDVCGRLMNRATGRCICADDLSARVPVAAIAGGRQAPVASPGAVPARIAVEPDVVPAPFILPSPNGPTTGPDPLASVLEGAFSNADIALEPSANHDALSSESNSHASATTYVGPSWSTPATTDPIAGWYRDPWDHAPYRWWDGHDWTGHVHVQAAAPEAPWSEPAVAHGPRFAVLSRVRSGRKAFDAHLFPAEVVFTPVAGANPETVGAVIGVFVGLFGTVVGSALGRSVARKQSARRVQATVGLDPSALAQQKGAVLISADELTGVQVQPRRRRGTVTLRRAGGNPIVAKWTDGQTGKLDVPGLLSRVAPDRTVTIPQSVASRVGAGLVLVLAILAVVAVCTFLVTSYLGRGEKSTRGGANGAITPAAVCIPSTAPAQETQPTAGQIAALAADATSAATSDRACVD